MSHPRRPAWGSPPPAPAAAGSCRPAATAINPSLCSANQAYRSLTVIPSTPGAPCSPSPACTPGSGSHAHNLLHQVARQGSFAFRRRGRLLTPRTPQLRFRPRRLRRGARRPAPLKRLGWYHVPCCRSAPIESSRLLLASEDSALRLRRFRTDASLLRPRLTSPCPSPAVASRIVRFARTGTETSQGKLCLLPSAPAGFTCTRVRMTIGPPRPLPGYPTTPALYPVSVRRVRVLPPASFRFRLAADTLALASGSGHHGPQRTCTSWIHNMPGAHKRGGPQCDPPLSTRCRRILYCPNSTAAVMFQRKRGSVRSGRTIAV